MRRIYLSIIAVFTGIGFASAQEVNHAKCGADFVLQQQLEDPESRHSYENFLRSAVDHANNPNVEVERDEFGKRIIPVVFHVLHKGKSGNISKEQIERQVDILNEDFNRLNADTTNTPHRFRTTEEGRFRFLSDDPNDYTPYTSSVSGPTVSVSNTRIDGVVLHCDSTVETYSTGQVEYDRDLVIITLDTVLNGGTGYTDGQYDGVHFTGGDGIGAIADFTVVSGMVDSVALIYGGEGYGLDTLSVNPLNVGGTGIDFQIVVGSVGSETVAYNITDSSMVSLGISDSACGVTPVLFIINLKESDYFYAKVNDMVVDSVFMDTVSSITTVMVEAQCHLKYAAPVVNTTARLSYITIATPAGDQYSFYFNNGLSSLTPSGAPGTLVEVTLPAPNDSLVGLPTCGTDAEDIAQAFSDAVDNLGDFKGLYLIDVFDVPTVRVIGELNGNADDFISNELPSVLDSTYTDGGILAAGMDIEFRLARKDPLGNCTEGIVRVFSTKSEEARNETGFKAESYWTATKYLNVWTINSIEHLGVGGTTLGYAQFPASGLLSTDGIAVRHDNIGDVGTAAPGNRVGRTSVHEVGHWLGLRHIWGDNTCGSDDVADTPVHQDPNFGICGNVGQQWFEESYRVSNCDPEWRGEMFSNYMDYVDDICMNMFTVNQIDRMNFTIHGDGSDFGIRSEMVSESNLIFTGTADPYSANAGCAPIADFYHDQEDFYASTAMICAGESVNFEDHSYNSDVSSRNWSFPGGSPGSSTITNPQITYGTAGSFDVTLTANGADGLSNTRTSENYVIVSSVVAQNQSSWGYVEAFWDSAAFKEDFVLFNQDGSANEWEWISRTGAGYETDEAVRMYNVGNVRGEFDDLITPSFNLSGLDNATLKFRYSGAASNGTPSDQLIIYSSDDCGETWRPRETMAEQELTNYGFSSISYVPNASSPWDVKEVDLSAHDNEPNVRIKFEWQAGGNGNNFYIDDITIGGGPIGVKENQADVTTWSLAPNPASNSTRLTINTNGRADVHMKMYDLLGKEVRDLYHGEVTKGAFNLDINLDGLQLGMYIIKANVNAQQITERLIVN